MKYFLLVGFLLGFTNCKTAPTQGAGQKLKIVPHVDVHGHRGARWLYPENTIPAFEYALSVGVDYIEMDLGVSKDNILVVYHDQFLNPDICLDSKGEKIKSKIALNSLRLKEIKTYDCGTLVNPRFTQQTPVPGTKIPTLQEFFDWIKNSKNPHSQKVKFNIEMKSEEALPKLSPKPAQFAKLLISILKKNNMIERTVIQSFDHRTLVEARKLYKNAVISALIEDRPKVPLVDIAVKLKANFVSPNHEWLTSDDVFLLHTADVSVAPWTANTKEDWKKLISMGVDAIITDNPKALIEYLK